MAKFMITAFAISDHDERTQIICQQPLESYSLGLCLSKMNVEVIWVFLPRIANKCSSPLLKSHVLAGITSDGKNSRSRITVLDALSRSAHKFTRQ